jgi:hypothetical protein
MNAETAEQINTRAALKVAVRALDSIVNADETEAHIVGKCEPDYCATHIAEVARREVAALMGV